MTNYSQNIHTMRGGTAHSHIPPMPFFVFILRIAQIVLAFLLLILAAYSLSVLGSWSGFGMTIFTCIWTWLVLAYILVSSRFFPLAYNVWGHLALESLAVLFWLVSWALTASEASLFTYLDGFYLDDYLGYGNGKNYSSAVGTGKATAGIGALEWILFVITLIVFGLEVHKWRLAGNTGMGGPEMGVANEQHKMDPVVNQAPATGEHYPQQYVPQEGQQYTNNPPV